MVKAPQDRKYRSCCSSFFVKEEGVISLSLKTLTLVGTITMTVALFIMLYITCWDDLLTKYHGIPVEEACSFSHHNPMVSDVICLPFFDRIWCILTTFFSLAVMQVNIRAFYKRFHGVLTVEENNAMVSWGWAICLSFPLIGYFDEWNYAPIHFTLAGIFFTSTCVYGHKLGNVFYHHRAQFPRVSDNMVWWVKFQGNFMLLMLPVFALSFAFHFHVPLWEWILAVSYINQFIFSAFFNEFYDSVMPYHKREKKEQESLETSYEPVQNMA